MRESFLNRDLGDELESRRGWGDANAKASPARDGAMSAGEMS